MASAGPPSSPEGDEPRSRLDITNERTAVRFELHVRLGQGKARAMVVVWSYDDGNVTMALGAVPKRKS